MPNQSHSGIHGIPWLRCQRCSKDFPSNQLSIQPGKGKGAGLRVCKDCLDKTSNQYRDEQIKAVLASRPEEMPLADILKSPPNPDDTRS